MKSTKEKIIDHVKMKGGKIISFDEELVDRKTKIKIECNNGHIFYTKWVTLKKNSWCRFCSYDDKRTSFEELEKFAGANNGKCLSSPDEFINNKCPVKWQCEYEHTWWANWDNIKNKGKWCPGCKGGFGEELCRQYFEKIFGEEFNKIKPNWLIDSISGWPLELDGYCEKLNIAFEHQGLQHYKITEYSKTEEILNNIKRKDSIKVEKCKKRGVSLIIIPQVPNLTAIDKLQELISNQCKNFNIKINENVDFTNFKMLPRAVKFLERYKKIAESYGGKCLADSYFGDNIKMPFECKEGHIFSSLPTNINQGHWCRICSAKEGNRKRKERNA